MTTTLITGPTGGLGRSTALAIAGRPAAERPDLVFVGRSGDRMDDVVAAARALGANVHAVAADLSSLAEVRAAGARVKELIAAGDIAPLSTLIANAGLSVTDTRGATADGYERTFAVNHLAHAQLIGDLLDVLTPPARIVFLGSNTYYLNTPRRLLGVPEAQWADPLELAMPAPADQQPTARTAGIAYSNSKLALLYYAHELQRRAPDGVNVIVYEPGFMPGSGLSREHGERMQRIGRAIERIPGVSSPAKSGLSLASVALDPQWAHLQGGAFVVKNAEREIEPFAHDRAREQRLWAATSELLARAESASSEL